MAIVYRARAATLAVPSGRKALVFPSNTTGASNDLPFVALKFASPQSNGLPAMGPANAGVTYMWRVWYVQQTGYYALFWWGQGDAGFVPSKTYYGCHPYPTTANNTGTVHNWEIAGNGGDAQFTRVVGGTTVKQVVKGQWFTQGLRVDYNGGSPKLIFYTALPSVADADVIEIDFPSGYGDAANYPNTPTLFIGDSPWYAGYQNERLSGKLAELMIWPALATEAQVVAQSNNLQSDSIGGIWFGKKTWDTVDDLTCEYGTGRSFVWADPANKGTVEDL